jgi:hypothetical protein
MGPTAGVDAVEKRKNLLLLPGIEQKLLGLPARSLITILTELRRVSFRPIANLTCFPKSTYYSGINIFNNLPSSLKSLKNEKAEFKVALKRYLNTHAFHSVDEFLLSKTDSSF